MSSAARQVTAGAVYGGDNPCLGEVLGQECECGGPSILSTSPGPSSRSTPTASATVASAVTTHPILGVFGVLLGAMNATCAGHLLGVGLADLRGSLHLGVDNASWLGTAFKAAMMFIGPFSVYLGGLFGVRRVLLTCGALFTIVSVLLPFAGGLADHAGAVSACGAYGGNN
jgi:hypothetical protein